MGILAIDAMNAKGQAGTAVIARAASDSEANTDFATELDRNLQVNTDPTPTSGVADPECIPAKGISSKDGNQSGQAGEPSAVSLAAIVTARSATALSNSTADEKPAPSSEQAATINSDSLAFSFPMIASTFAKDSPQPANDRGEETANLPAATTDETSVSVQAALRNEVAKKANPNAGILSGEATQGSTSALKSEASRGKDSKAPSANKSASPEDSSTLPPSCLAQAFATGQDGSTYVAGSAPTSEQTDALDATSPNAQTPTQDQQLRDVSRSISFEVPKAASTFARTEASQDKDSEAPSASKAPSAKASATSQSSQAAPVATAGQEGSVLVTGSVLASACIETLPATSRNCLGKELQGAGVDSTAVAENPQDNGDKTTVSLANKGELAEASSTMQPSQATQVVAVGQAVSALVAGSVPTPAWRETLHATSSSGVDKELQGAGVESTAKTEDSQDNGKKTTVPPANKGAPTDAGSTLQPSQAVQVVTAGQEMSGLVPGSAPTRERIEATGPSYLSNELQAAGVGIRAPLNQGTTQLGSREQADSGPEVQSSAQDALDLNVQVSTSGPSSSDFSLAMPFELTKVMSTGRVDDPQNPNRIKSSQEGKPATSGDADNADLGTPGTSLLQQPTQTKDKETRASKKDGEAPPDLTKMADGKDNPPKANADPQLVSQFIRDGRAEAGRASSGAAGASQGRGGGGSAAALGGCQADAETMVRSARLTQQAGSAEMQVRLRSEALGSIDVHTTVKGSDIGASIRVEGHDTQVMLANELSQLERALNERSLRVKHLDVLQGSVSEGQSNGAGSGNSYGSSSEPRQSFSSYSAGRMYTSLPEAPAVSDDWGLGLSSTRINLRV